MSLKIFNCIAWNGNTYFSTFSYITLFDIKVIKFNITLYNGILLTYTSELFPTVVRTLGYGLCMTSGKAGLI